MWKNIAVAGALLATASGASAKDDKPCQDGLVCASKPETVAAALMKAGYQGLLSKDKVGDPMVDSAASGYKFSVYFYGCDKNVACDSVQFYAGFRNEEGRGVEFVNKWNASKRFVQMSIDPADQGLVLRYDVTTAGGLTQANFADVIDWFAVMLDAFDEFAEENPGMAAVKGA